MAGRQGKFWEETRYIGAWMERSLIVRVDAVAAERGVSRSVLLREALERVLTEQQEGQAA